MDKLKQKILVALSEGLKECGSMIKPEFLLEFVWKAITDHFKELYK